jgi:hypothetical protein
MESQALETGSFLTQVASGILIGGAMTTFQQRQKRTQSSIAPLKRGVSSVMVVSTVPGQLTRHYYHDFI